MFFYCINVSFHFVFHSVQSGNRSVTSTNSASSIVRACETLQARVSRKV